IPASSNFGAQSSSVSIMYQLVSLGATSIRIVYVESDLVGSTWGKLKVLILGLPDEPVATYPLSDTVTLNFTQVQVGGDPNFETTMPFGITGGWDGNQSAILDFLNVESFCCLQTYLWEGQDYQPRTNVIYQKEEGGTKTYEFPEALNMRFRAYYTEDPQLTQSEFQTLQEQDARKAGCLKALDSLVKDDKILMIPVYFSPNRIKGKFQDVFFNLFLGILDYIKFTKDTRPVVLAVMSSPPTGYYDAVKTMLDGTAVSDISDTGVLTTIPKESYPSRYLNYQQKGYFPLLEKVAFLTTPETCTEENINNTVNGNENNIIVAGIEGLPKVAFDYIFGIGNSIRIFEGMATASSELNLGKLFIRILADDTGEDGNVYRLPPLGEDPNTTSFGKYMMRLSSIIDLNAAEWNYLINRSISEKLLPDYLLGSFMISSVTPDSDLFNDFNQLREFYHNSIEDKLRNGLFYWQTLNS
ncbi:MAG: hypothetical protein HRT68_05405, partial [Flavobacteriaceae bacterium]|nr:hypothetical protein [Flavobacteriaceae bacterium]